MMAKAVMKFCEWRSAAWQARAKRALDLRDWWAATKRRVARQGVRRSLRAWEDVQ